MTESEQEIIKKQVSKAFDILYTLNGGEKKKHSELEVSAKTVLSLVGITESNETYASILKLLIDRYEIEVGIETFQPNVVVDNPDSVTWFFEAKEKKRSTPFYTRYKAYLAADDFEKKAIDNITEVTEKTLSLCENPNSHDPNGKKRGLVVGDVQSGKTSNYLALINMALDYGYRTILLLAGLNEDLRVQTQKRVDAGVIGAISETIGNEIEFCGVGIATQSYFAVPFTNTENDFNSFINSNLNSTITDYNKPVILVVKKNKKILESVIEKLQAATKQYGNNNILIIDDEADNASVNTKKEDEDPSAINRCIREIFNKFPVATYVGYTATPFANVLIDPEDKGPDNLDLFPADFIVQLNAPGTYFGLSKVFPEGDILSKHIRILDEEEPFFLPVKHTRFEDFNFMPESMKEAIRMFLINNVIRTLRGQKGKHRTMMINISRFNPVQHKIDRVVSEYIDKLKRIITQDSYKKTEKFIQNIDMKGIYDLFMGPFYDDVRTGDPERGLPAVEWEEIQQGLCDEINQFEVKTINSTIKKQDRIDYDKYKKGARLIAVGGFVLSRGLTLEGLMVSYYSRNSGTYDTLLQMCRWFGYRPKYEDLCCIYMSSTNLDRFEVVRDAVTDLREQFAEMERQNKKPKDFGLMVKESPATLETKSFLVTSRNKLLHSEQFEVYLNYGGTYADTSKFENRASINEHNIDAFKEFYKNVGNLPNAFKEEKNPMASNVSKYDVASLIRELKISYLNTKFDTQGLAEYIENSDVFPYWDVVIATGDSDNYKLTQPLGLHIKPPVRTFTIGSNDDEKEIIKIGGSNNRVLDPGIFNCGLGLTAEAKNKILAQKDIDFPEDAPHKNMTAKDYLKIRETPMLVIYFFDLRSKDEANYNKHLKKSFPDDEPLIAFAVGFPSKQTTVKFKYRVNKIKEEEIKNAYYKADEEEEEEEAEESAENG